MTPGTGTNQARAQVGAPPGHARGSSSTYQELFTATVEGEIPDDDHEEPRRPRRSTRRRLIVLLVALALVLAAVGTGYAWTTHAAKQPALKALRAGNDAFGESATDLRGASELADLHDSARRASAAADRVDRAARPITPPGTGLERRVLAVLRTEATILRAVAEIDGLGLAQLDRWPSLNDRLATAEEALQDDVRQLATEDQDAARPLRRGFALAPHTTEVVADHAATSVTGRLETHLADLTAAKTTRDVRTAAARAGRSSVVVAKALEGLDATSPQGEQVSGVGDTLDVLGGLRRLTGDRLDQWKPIRAELLAASADLEDIDAGAAVDTLDALVSEAGQKLRSWRLATAKAKARSEKDSARLTDYAEATRAALEDLGTASRTVAEFSGQVQQSEQGGVTYPKAVTFLDRAGKDLATVGTALADVTATPRLRAQHRALREGLDRAVEAVESGYAGIRRPAGCLTPAQKRALAAEPGPTPAPVCLYIGSEGWPSFREGWDGASQDLLAARTAWDARVEEVRSAIEGRKLPRKPVV